MTWIRLKTNDLGVLSQCQRSTFYSFTHMFLPMIPLSLESHQTNFCRSCFDEVCSRCSTSGEGVAKRKEVRIDELPVCAQPPLGATALSSGTTIAALTLEKGYFRVSNQSHVVLKCYEEDACHGGDDIEKYCTSGYTGPCEKSLVFSFLQYIEVSRGRTAPTGLTRQQLSSTLMRLLVPVCLPVTYFADCTLRPNRGSIIDITNFDNKLPLHD